MNTLEADKALIVTILTQAGKSLSAADIAVEALRFDMTLERAHRACESLVVNDKVCRLVDDPETGTKDRLIGLS